MYASNSSSIRLGSARAAGTSGATSALCLTLLSAGAWAADPAATNSDNQLQEIVVTAQFRQQNLQDTPVAITAVTGAMMEERGQTSLRDLGQQAPNVQLLETGGAFGPGMTASIRGIGQYDIDPALAPGVGIYIDDVYYTSVSGSNFALLDLDRVEILRGPQGTLAGANSEGGAIKMYSVKPQGDNSGSVKVSYGERNLLDFQGMADIPLIDNLVFMRISGVSHQQDGYVTRVDYGCAFPNSGVPSVAGLGQSCVAGKEGGKDYNGGRLALRWVPSDTFEANLAGDVTIDKSEVSATTLLYVNAAAPGALAAAINSGGVAYNSRFISSNPYISYADFCAYGLALTAKGPGPTTTPNCFSPYTYTKTDGVNLTLDWKIADDLSLKSITAYRQYDVQYTNDDDVSPVGSSLGWSELENHTFTQELRLTGKVSSLIDYTVGGFFLDQVTTYPTTQILDYVIPGLPFEFLGDDPVAERDYAGFANATWHIVDRLNLNVGVRETHQEKTYTYNRYNPPSAGGGDSIFFAPTFSGTQGKYEGSKFDYRVNLDYRWTEDLMTYASVSTGFKGGGTNPRPFESSQVVPFGPEDLTAYEIGAKTDWLDRSLRVNVALFYNKYHDIQVVLLSCPQFSGGSTTEPCAAPVNGGDAVIDGGELETSYRVAGFTLDGTYSHQHFEYKSVNPLAGIPLNSTGQGFQPSKWSLGAQYDWHLPNSATLSPRVDWIFASGYYTDASNDPYSDNPGYHEINARISYKPQSGGWEVAVVGSNLADKLWYYSLFDLTATQGQVYGLPSAPRTIWGEFKKKF